MNLDSCNEHGIPDFSSCGGVALSEKPIIVYSAKVDADLGEGVIHRKRSALDKLDGPRYHGHGHG